MYLMSSFTADTAVVISKTALQNFPTVCIALFPEQITPQTAAQHCGMPSPDSHPEESLLADSGSLPLPLVDCELRSHDPCHLENG